MKQKRKAISPIIATLILIVITVIAGIFLYSFVSGYLGTLSGTTNQPPPNVQFIASSVSPNSPNNSGYTFSFTVENLGTTGVTFETNALLINAENGQLAGPASVSVSGATTQGTIAPNSEATITVTYSTALPAGNYYVKFTTTSGYTIQSPTVYVS